MELWMGIMRAHHGEQFNQPQFRQKMHGFLVNWKAAMDRALEWGMHEICVSRQEFYGIIALVEHQLHTYLMYKASHLIKDRSVYDIEGFGRQLSQKALVVANNVPPESFGITPEQTYELRQCLCVASTFVYREIEKAFGLHFRKRGGPEMEQRLLGVLQMMHANYLGSIQYDDFASFDDFLHKIGAMFWQYMDAAGNRPGFVGPENLKNLLQDASAYQAQMLTTQYRYQLSGQRGVVAYPFVRKQK